jgi:hypothetical protein
METTPSVNVPRPMAFRRRLWARASAPANASPPVSQMQAGIPGRRRVGKIPSDKTATRTSPYDGGKTRLLTLEDLDKRTRAAQRAFDIHDRLVAERGGPESMSVLRYSLTRSVAVLSAMGEDMQARWLRGEKIDPSQMPRCSMPGAVRPSSSGWTPNRRM